MRSSGNSARLISFSAGTATKLVLSEQVSAAAADIFCARSRGHFGRAQPGRQLRAHVRRVGEHGHPAGSDDANGKLSTVVVGSNTQSNVYDPSANLLLQTDGTAGTTLYAGDTQLHVAPGATATRTYAFINAPRIVSSGLPAVKP